MRPSISVVIPFRDRSALTVRAIRSLIRTQGDTVTQILLVDNGSRSAERAIVRRCIDRLRLKCTTHLSLLSWDRPFNWQRINNFAARHATGDTLCFLNNDVSFDRSSFGLLLRMAQRAHKDGVGIVGCLLRYPDGTIQHAGGRPDRGFCHSHYCGEVKAAYLRDRPHKYLTGACHVISTTTFRELGGYDSRFVLVGGDVELCVRAAAKGLTNWFVGSASFIHLESKTRKNEGVAPSDFRRLYYAMMPVYVPREGVTVGSRVALQTVSSLERYYGFPSSMIKKIVCSFAGRGLEFLPGIPHKRDARLTLFCDGLGEQALDSLLRRAKRSRRAILLVGHGLSAITTTKQVAKIDLQELSGPRRVFWIDTRLDDTIWASKKMFSIVTRSFSGHAVRCLPE